MAAAAAITTTALGACSGTDSNSESDAERSAETVPMTPSGPVCSADATTAPTPYPDGVPADLPLPPDTVVYEVGDRGDTGIVLTGVSSQPLDSVREFFNTEWPRAGYKLSGGETEELDAESNWQFEDYTGRWAIQDLTGICEGETAVQVLSTK